MSTKWTRMLSWAALAALMIAAPAVPAHGAAPPPAPGGPATFDTPQAAADALPVFLINHADTADALRLGEGRPRRRVSYRDLEPALDRLQGLCPCRADRALARSLHFPAPLPINHESIRRLDSAFGAVLPPRAGAGVG